MRFARASGLDSLDGKSPIPPLHRIGFLYGTEAEVLLRYGSESPDWLQPLGAERSAVRGEVRLAIEHGMARTLADVLDRRMALLLFGDQGGVGGAQGGRNDRCGTPGVVRRPLQAGTRFIRGACQGARALGAGIPRRFPSPDGPTGILGMAALRALTLLPAWRSVRSPIEIHSQQTTSPNAHPGYPTRYRQQELPARSGRSCGRGVVRCSGGERSLRFWAHLAAERQLRCASSLDSKFQTKEASASGAVRSQGHDVGSPPRNGGVGMVFQDYALFPHLTVGQNVTFGLEGTPKAEREARAREVLGILDLRACHDRYPHELSGGQQQRVSLARALAPEPVVVLMDEPFSNLDAHLRNQVRDEVVGILRATGVTCILVSHDQRDALAISDRVAVMNQGRIEQIGSPREIYKHPESVFVATFVGRTNLLQGIVQNENGCVLTDFGSFCRVDRLGMPNGSEVMVAVRPDGFVACPESEGILHGRLLSTTYAGAHLEAEMAIPSAHGGERHLVVHLPPSRAYQVGERLSFRLLPEFASVVRNACTTLGFASPLAVGSETER